MIGGLHQLLDVTYAGMACSPTTSRRHLTTTAPLRPMQLLCIPFFLYFVISKMATKKDLLQNAMFKNCTTYFEATKDLRSVGALRDRDTVLSILLHSDGMSNITEAALPTSFIAKQLGGVSRRFVNKCRNSKVAFKAMSDKPRKKTLRKSSFIYKHNDLCRKMVNFWIEESVPSPNKRDVKIKHSEKPGDHERIKDPNGVSFSIHCKTKKCQTAQRRFVEYVGCKLCA